MKNKWYRNVVALAMAVIVAAGAASATEFVNIKVGARGLAMGGAFTAVSDDANLLQYNPAGLAFLTKKELMISYVRWLAETDTQYMSYVHPNLFKSLNFGIGLQWFDVAMMKTDFNGFELGDLKVSENLTVVSLSSKLNPKLAIGANVKVCNSTLSQYQSTSLMVDAGILLLGSMFDIGASVNTLQIIPSKFRDVEENVPMTVSAGVTKFMRKTVISADVMMPMGGEVVIAAGMEYILMPELAFQFGYRVSADSVQNLSIGARLNLVRGEDAYMLNIAYLPVPDVSDILSASFNIKFK